MAAKGSVGPTYKLVLRLLEQDGPMTGVEVADALKIHRNTAGWNLRKAHENGAIHICEYERKVGVRGDWARIYKFGPGTDAKLPKIDERVYQARHYQKRKVILQARKRVKMDGNNPFGAIACLNKSKSAMFAESENCSASFTKTEPLNSGFPVFAGSALKLAAERMQKQIRNKK